MLFDDISADMRAKAIKCLEESLFGEALAVRTIGAHFFSDVPETYPGFNVSSVGKIPHYRVTIDPSLFKK